MDLPSVTTDNFDVVVPGAIVFLALFIMLVASRLARPRSAPLEMPDPEPTVAPPPARVATGELQAWHLEHGRTVQQWIEIHENVLQNVSAQGLQLDLLGEGLTSAHDDLSRPMRFAITSHPSPAMRAQLSALVVSSEATLHALRRSEYQDAERQHVTYLDYRDQWLERLRQFSQAESEDRLLQTIPEATPPTESIWLPAVEAESDVHPDFDDSLPIVPKIAHDPDLLP